MSQSSARVPCPFCAESILPNALKCMHCGEWLNKTNREPVSPALSKSQMARAVSKGIKEQKQDEFNSGCLTTLAVFVAMMVGFTIGEYSSGLGWIVGLLLFGFLAVKIDRNYKKE